MRYPVMGDTIAQVGTPMQVDMLPQHRLVLQHRLICYPNTGWYANPTQVGMLTLVQIGMLLQRRLVCYSSKSVELPMIYRFVIDYKTMTRCTEAQKQ
jgi:hypothetical protein